MFISPINVFLRPAEAHEAVQNVLRNYVLGPLKSRFETFLKSLNKAPKSFSINTSAETGTLHCAPAGTRDKGKRGEYELDIHGEVSSRYNFDFACRHILYIFRA